MPSPSGGVVVGRRSEDLLEPTLLLTHQEGAAVARLLRVVAAAAAAPNADFRKVFGLCLAVPGFYTYWDDAKPKRRKSQAHRP